MERHFELIIGALTFVVLVQVIVLTGILLSFRRMTAQFFQMRKNLESKFEPAMEDFRDVMREARKLLANVQTAAENFVQLSDTVKTQVQRVNAVIEDTTVRARVQIAKVDEVVSDAVDKMHATTEVIQQSVLAPVRELSALISGISSGLQFLFSKRKNQVDEVHQDEELFI